MKHNSIWIASVLFSMATGCSGPNPIEVPAVTETTPAPVTTEAGIHEAVGKHLTMTAIPSPQYEASGIQSLVDGKMGSDEYMDLEWMGWWYEEKPFEATIDLGKATAIRELGVHTLTSVESWIFYPRKVVFELSMDGKVFETVATLKPNDDDFETDYPDEMIMKAKDLKREARYVRVKAERYGALPAWHGAHGGADGVEGQAWLFIDEILVNPRK